MRGGPVHLDGIGPEIRGHVRRRVEQRVQLQGANRPLDSAGKAERTVNALGGDARDTGQLIGADLVGQFGLGARALAHRDDERQVQQVHLQADFVGDPHQGRMGELAEVDIGHQVTRVVGLPFVIGVDRIELCCGGTGSAHDVGHRVVVDLGM